MHETSNPTARPAVYNSPPQYLHCLRSSANMDVQDRLGFLCQRLGGWFSIRGDCVDYFVPESKTYMMYLIDPDISRHWHMDYVV